MAAAGGAQGSGAARRSESQHQSQPQEDEVAVAKRWLAPKSGEGLEERFVVKKKAGGNVIDTVRGKQSFFSSSGDAKISTIIKTVVNLARAKPGEFNTDELLELQARINNCAKNKFNFMFRIFDAGIMKKDVSSLISKKILYISDVKKEKDILGKHSASLNERSLTCLSWDITRERSWDVSIGGGGWLKPFKKTVNSGGDAESLYRAEGYLKLANRLLGKDVDDSVIKEKARKLVDAKNDISQNLKEGDLRTKHPTAGVVVDNQDILVLKLLSSDFANDAMEPLQRQIVGAGLIPEIQLSNQKRVINKTGDIVSCITTMPVNIKNNVYEGDVASQVEMASLVVVLRMDVNIKTGEVTVKVDRKNLEFVEDLSIEDGKKIIDALNTEIQNTPVPKPQDLNKVDILLNQSRGGTVNFESKLTTPEVKGYSDRQMKYLFERKISELKTKVSQPDLFPPEEDEDLVKKDIDMAKLLDNLFEGVKNRPVDRRHFMRLLSAAIEVFEDHFFSGKEVNDIKKQLEGPMFQNLPNFVKTALMASLCTKYGYPNEFLKFFEGIDLVEEIDNFEKISGKWNTTIRQKELENLKFDILGAKFNNEIGVFNDDEVSGDKLVASIVDVDNELIGKDLTRDNYRVKIGDVWIEPNEFDDNMDPKEKDRLVIDRFKNIMNASNVMMETGHDDPEIIRRMDSLIEKDNSIKPFELQDGVRGKRIDENMDFIPLKLLTQAPKWYMVDPVARLLLNYKHENFDITELDTKNTEIRREGNSVVAEVVGDLPIILSTNKVAKLEVKMIETTDLNTGKTEVRVTFSNVRFEKDVSPDIKKKLLEALRGDLPKHVSKSDATAEAVAKTFQQSNRSTPEVGMVLKNIEKIGNSSGRVKFLRNLIEKLKNNNKDPDVFINKMFEKVKIGQLELLKTYVKEIYGEEDFERIFGRSIQERRV